MVHILCVNTWFVLYVLIHGSCCMCLDMFMIVVFDNSVLPGKSPCIYGIHPAWYLHISSEKSDVWNSQIAYGDLEVWWPLLSHGFWPQIMSASWLIYWWHVMSACDMAHLLVTYCVCLQFLTLGSNHAQPRFSVLIQDWSMSLPGLLSTWDLNRLKPKLKPDF